MVCRVHIPDINILALNASYIAVFDIYSNYVCTRKELKLQVGIMSQKAYTQVSEVFRIPIGRR